MERKAIFFDIDGTLLNHEKELPEKTEKAVRTLQEEGHFVGIATGRGPFMFKDLRKTLGIDTFVSFNGQYVESQGEVVLKNRLDPDVLEDMTAFAEKTGHPLVYMDQHGMRANREEDLFIQEAMASLEFAHPPYDPAYRHGRDIFQTLLFCREQEEDPYKSTFNDFDFIRWHPVSTDVLPMGGSKAKGIEAVARHLNIDHEDIYVFGDGPNDIEMLSFTDKSVAMGNSVEQTKQAASFVTKDVDDGGIVHGLKHFGLL
ncbi:Cof-type HAD-IIB family hydrolase [Salisediminibacterium halotolerans]|uniref:Cof subfamily of IIB subfamily of haloacid dehalogenase superfamily/HAD-superfamily hydrolase, subfamily IIB n=1 Tax=Salisediminibacterium halotolerans TaxID=517425 RepID=A0A1H9W7Z3_9BACI|nr:Cof-type HAD-IIB family hydrolase [Salisediminibacterium haloalkalitolerans]SES29965.1 hypothetical protein SAMN05444126_12913 [Salisediminibacterium haloalkalitolerans]